jgi:hypothetical protein
MLVMRVLELTPTRLGKIIENPPSSIESDGLLGVAYHLFDSTDIIHP